MGFFPSLSPNSQLLGCFHINHAHNVVHNVTGIFVLWTGCASRIASKIFCKGLRHSRFAVGIIAISFGFGSTCDGRRHNIALL